jgi:phenylalanyl-tRNA synthetase alpha chain
MAKILHQPTLESIARVEEVIKNNSGLGNYQLWKKLPKKMMYQTFLLILDYLTKSGKISIVNKKINWIHKENIFKQPISSERKEISEEISKEKMSLDAETESLVESLNPDERVILAYLKEKDFKKILEKAGMDETRGLRALQFLSNKNIVKISSKEGKIVDLGDNGVVYLKNGLPERRLIELVSNEKNIKLDEAKQKAKLSDNEFSVALGALKKKALILLEKGEIVFNAKKEEIVKKTLEEQFLEVLPVSLNELKPEQKFALESLKSRKDIVRIEEKKEIEVEITELGKKLAGKDFSKISMIESLTPEIIRDDSWMKKKFRRYDIRSKVPSISGGKRHFVDQARDYARKVWSQLGFREMSGSYCQTGFWNFDALFTAQDHPVREIQDTFYLPIKGKLPDRDIVDAVKKAHEGNFNGSRGWQYKWKEEDPKKVILRTHTTCLSARTLASLRKLKEKNGKFFAVGKCFRNETVDWGHLFEFNQTEGIVVDKNANFQHLLGYLKEFFKKMGFDDVKFYPSYFPYTEPSVEIYGWNKLNKVWMEIGGAGIFRPEVVIPLLGEYIPVLAWGPGFDRSIMEYYNIKDLREMYKNNLKQLREMKIWKK